MIDPAHLHLETMASGHLTLVLREGAEWGEFGAFATGLMARLDGEVVSRADSPVERVWTVRVRGVDLWLAFDDWHHRYEFNSRDDAGDALLATLEAELRGPN
jgi:hypothetical protein